MVQAGSERRIEVFVKMHKKKIGGSGGVGFRGSGCWGQGGCERRIEVCGENFKKKKLG